MSEELLPQISALAAELREAGINVEVALETTKKFGKQFELAQKKGRRFVLVLGSEELERGLVRVKDLKSGEQQDVPRAELLPLLMHA
jgi:histidyl-tRNA synthetase